MYVNLKQAKEKRELLFLKDVNICDWNVLSVEGMIFRIITAKIFYTKQNKKESRKLNFCMAIKFTYSLALTCKVEHESGSSAPKPRPPLSPVIAFHHVKKFLLTIEIVDQESELSHTFCKLHVLTYFISVFYILLIAQV